MDGDMAAMFPNGIRALIVDDDTKFLKSATATLAGLNFEGTTCALCRELDMAVFLFLYESSVQTCVV